MNKKTLKWVVYSIGFSIISIPIHLQIGSSVWTWISVSMILGFFAGILNEILAEIKKK